MLDFNRNSCNFVSVASNRSLRKNTGVLYLQSEISKFLRHPALRATCTSTLTIKAMLYCAR